jgi:large subunit ribosomal protein L9
MKVILITDIFPLGLLGEIKNVSRGYARNFLLPFNKAKVASEANLAEVTKMWEDYKAKQLHTLEIAHKNYDAINNLMLTNQARAGFDGKLFGSITAVDIIKMIEDTSGIRIHRSAVMLPDGVIKSLGEYMIDIKLHHEVTAKIMINISNIQQD